jgi:hypothetical protein
MLGRCGSRPRDCPWAPGPRKVRRRKDYRRLARRHGRSTPPVLPAQRVSRCYEGEQTNAPTFPSPPMSQLTPTRLARLDGSEQFRETAKGANGAVWDPERGEDVMPENGRADVWVFALHTCREHSLYDPLDEKQWAFWTAPHWTIARCGQSSGGLAFLNKVAGQPVEFGRLASAVKAARRRNDEIATSA